MEHICENCQYIDRENGKCLFIMGSLPMSKSCTMWKVNLKKEIERIREEMQSVNNARCIGGACEIKR